MIDHRDAHQVVRGEGDVDDDLEDDFVGKSIERLRAIARRWWS